LLPTQYHNVPRFILLCRYPFPTVSYDTTVVPRRYVLRSPRSVYRSVLPTLPIVTVVITVHCYTILHVYAFCLTCVLLPAILPTVYCAPFRCLRAVLPFLPACLTLITFPVTLTFYSWYHLPLRYTTLPFTALPRAVTVAAVHRSTVTRSFVRLPVTCGSPRATPACRVLFPITVFLFTFTVSFYRSPPLPLPFYTPFLPRTRSHCRLRFITCRYLTLDFRYDRYLFGLPPRLPLPLFRSVYHYPRSAAVGSTCVTLFVLPVYHLPFTTRYLPVAQLDYGYVLPFLQFTYLPFVCVLFCVALLLRYIPVVTGDTFPFC